MASSLPQALNSKASRQEDSGYSRETIWNPVQMKRQITTTALQPNTSSPSIDPLPLSTSWTWRSTPSLLAGSLPPVLPPNVQSKRSLRSAYGDYTTIYPIVKLPQLSSESDNSPFETNSNPIETNPIEMNKDFVNAPEIYPIAKLPSLQAQSDSNLTESDSNSVEVNSNPMKTNKDIVHPPDRGPGVHTVLEDFTHPAKCPSFLVVRKGQSVRLLHLFVISGLVTSSLIYDCCVWIDNFRLAAFSSTVLSNKAWSHEGTSRPVGVFSNDEALRRPSPCANISHLNIWTHNSQGMRNR